MTRIIKFFKDRMKNPQLYIRIIAISFLPILSALGTNVEGMITWYVVGDIIVRFISNPYLLGLYIFTLWQSFLLTKNKVK